MILNKDVKSLKEELSEIENLLNQLFFLLMEYQKKISEEAKIKNLFIRTLPVLLFQRFIEKQKIFIKLVIILFL